MRIDLKNVLQEHTSDTLIEKIAALLGENTDQVKKGLLSGARHLLKNIAVKLTAQDGESLYKSFGDGSKLDKLQSHLAGGNQTVKYLTDGLDKTRELLGNETDRTFQDITAHSGMRPESIPFLMGIVYPFVCGILGKQKSAGLDSAALQNLITSQINNLDMAQEDLIEKMSDSETNASHGFKESTPMGSTKRKAPFPPPNSDRAAAAIAKAETIVVPTGVSDLKVGLGQAMKSSKPRKRKLFPYFVFLLVLFAAVFLLKDPVKDLIQGINSGEQSPTTQNLLPVTNETQVDSELTQTPVAGSELNQTENSNNPVSLSSENSLQNGIVQEDESAQISKEALGIKVGDNLRFTLPGGVNIEVPSDSLEAGIMIALASNDPTIFEQINILDGINFTTGSDRLTDESRVQITNFATILNAYPEIKIQLRGHTDSHGSVDKNFGLSKRRAEAVKNSLMRLAVEEKRITTKGMGSIEPIANNDSPKGRAENRRIDIKFSQ